MATCCKLYTEFRVQLHVAGASSVGAYIVTYALGRNWHSPSYYLLLLSQTQNINYICSRALSYWISIQTDYLYLILDSDSDFFLHVTPIYNKHNGVSSTHCHS